MFALEVEYLLGRSFAGSFEDRWQPEWPPHPGRLFAALAASYFENGEAQREREALEWLEQQPPPGIRAGAAGESTIPVAFVPTNYPNANVPVLREKQPRRFPAQAPSEVTVHFIWAAEPPRGIAEVLDGLAARAGYLGKACSVVAMRAEDAAPEPNWTPDDAGDAVMRVPSKGRLAELGRLFAADQFITAGAQQRYRRTEDAQPGDETADSSFGAMLVYRKMEGPGLPIEAVLTLTDAVRRALMSNAGKGGPIEPILNGHEGGVHCAVAALPFVGREHADGHLMGFAVILPRQADLHQRRLVLRACGGLQEHGVQVTNSCYWRTEPVDAACPMHALRPVTWTKPEKLWRSVTPILLDRFPKKKGPSVEEILALSCRRAGLPQPEAIEHGPYSKVEGVPPVSAFRLHRSGEERTRWGVHATLRFAVPVRGPVLLGSGRFFGMGLMRPAREVGNERP